MPLVIPLPESSRRLLTPANLEGANPGLLLDKYVASWSGDSGGKGDFSEKVQRPTIENLIKATEPNDEMFNSLYKNWSSMIDHLVAAQGGRVHPLTTRSPLALHLSRASALENAGLCLHPVHGFAYLPGTGLKGLAHAYACEVWLASQSNRQHGFNTICRIFGYAPSPWLKKLAERLKVERPKGERAGAIVFHDAWPTSKPAIRMDIVNSHHPAYYDDSQADPPPPGDWENPIPVNFPVVKAGQKFLFPLTKRRNDVRDDDLQLAQQWLTGGLVELGAGAKTAAGYGYFQPPGDFTPKRPRIKVSLRLESPAFLGGPEHHAEEHPRLGAIKAMLRFWFRAWQGNLSTGELKQRETEVFGLIRTGPRLEIQPLGDTLSIWPRMQDMGRSPSKLGYMGYGPIQYQKDGSRTNKTQYDALRTDQELTFQLVCRNAADRDAVLKSLWLFGALGGLGSRSRRGWGSVTLTSKLQNGSTLPDLSSCTNREDYLAQLQAGLEMLSPVSRRKDAASTEWTALSKETRLVVSRTGFSFSKETLEDLGGHFMEFRNRDQRGSTSPGPDYHATKALLQEQIRPESVTGLPKTLPERAAFGLPYAQSYPSLKNGKTGGKPPAATFTPQWPKPSGKELVDGRRASPIICKIVRIQKQYYWQVAFLPSQFLPQNATVRAERTDIDSHPTLKNSPFPPPRATGVSRVGDTRTLLDDFLDWLEAGGSKNSGESRPARSTGGKKLRSSTSVAGGGVRPTTSAAKRPRGTPVRLQITGTEDKKGNIHWLVEEVHDPARHGRLFGDPPSDVQPQPGLQVDAFIRDDQPNNRQYQWTPRR